MALVRLNGLFRILEIVLKICKTRIDLTNSRAQIHIEVTLGDLEQIPDPVASIAVNFKPKLKISKSKNSFCRRKHPSARMNNNR